MFDRDYIEGEFKKIDKALTDSIKVYILGGGAMSYYNLKTATKDADIVLRHEGELESTIDSIKNSGYQEAEIKGTHQTPRKVFENKDGFRIDIFIDRICKGLKLSKGIRSRSEEFLTLKNLTLFALSPEDIFILKSVTNRERDRDDMYALFSHGLDFETIKDEIFYQTDELDDKAWLAFFFIGLIELKDMYSLEIPYYQTFYDMACDEVLKYRILEMIGDEPIPKKELMKDINDEEENIRKALEDLKEQDRITIDEQMVKINK